MNLNVRQLEAFVCLAHMGGFSRAARQLNISQAGLSILIKKLEEKLGVKLVERTTRNIKITPSGHQALLIAERILGDSRTIFSIGKGVLSDYSHNVSLALAPALATTILPEVLKSFHDLYPKVTTVFHECVNEELIGEIYSNDVEFGLGFGIKSNKELECRSIGKDELVMVCSPDHPLVDRKKVSWTDVILYPVITMPIESLARVEIEAVLLKINKTLAPIYAPSSSLTAVALAKERLGIAIVSSSVRPVVTAAQLVMKTVHNPIIKRDMNVVTRAGFSLSEPSQAFIKIFAQAINSMKW